MSDDFVPQMETLQRVAESSLRAQVERFRAIEEKVWRHAALLGVVLGAFVISIPQALKLIRQGSTLTARVFAGSYYATMVVALLGLFCFIMAMRYEELHTEPLREGFVDSLGGKKHVLLLTALARGMEEGYEKNRDAFDRKEWWARLGWWSLPPVLLFSGVAFGSYALLQL